MHRIKVFISFHFFLHIFAVFLHFHAVVKTPRVAFLTSGGVRLLRHDARLSLHGIWFRHRDINTVLDARVLICPITLLAKIKITRSSPQMCPAKQVLWKFTEIFQENIHVVAFAAFLWTQYGVKFCKIQSCGSISAKNVLNCGSVLEFSQQFHERSFVENV